MTDQTFGFFIGVVILGAIFIYTWIRSKYSKNKPAKQAQAGSSGRRDAYGQDPLDRDIVMMIEINADG
jgi:hypothetical protein